MRSDQPSMCVHPLPSLTPCLFGATFTTYVRGVHAARMPSCDCSSVMTISRSSSRHSRFWWSCVSALQVRPRVRLRTHDRVLQRAALVQPLADELRVDARCQHQAEVTQDGQAAKLSLAPEPLEVL